MSLDLTGEPFPKPDEKPMQPAYTCCRDGHIEVWYDSTDCPKCPLCAVMRREWGL